MLIQKTIIDNNTGETETFTSEVRTLAELSEWMMDNHPGYIDVYLLHVIRDDGDDLYFTCHRNDSWVITNEVGYQRSYHDTIRKAKDYQTWFKAEVDAGRIKITPHNERMRERIEQKRHQRV